MKMDENDKPKRTFSQEFWRFTGSVEARSVCFSFLSLTARFVCGKTFLHCSKRSPCLWSLCKKTFLCCTCRNVAELSFGMCVYTSTCEPVWKSSFNWLKFAWNLNHETTTCDWLSNFWNSNQKKDPSFWVKFKFSMPHWEEKVSGLELCFSVCVFPLGNNHFLLSLSDISLYKAQKTNRIQLWHWLKCSSFFNFMFVYEWNCAKMDKGWISFVSIQMKQKQNKANEFIFSFHGEAHLVNWLFAMIQRVTSGLKTTKPTPEWTHIKCERKRDETKQPEKETYKMLKKKHTQKSAQMCISDLRLKWSAAWAAILIGFGAVVK